MENLMVDFVIKKGKKRYIKIEKDKNMFLTIFVIFGNFYSICKMDFIL